MGNVGYTYDLHTRTRARSAGYKQDGKWSYAYDLHTRTQVRSAPRTCTVSGVSVSVRPATW